MIEAADAVMADKVARYGVEVMGYIEKQVLLQTLDHLWREHLVTLDHLRQVIGFRGYAQRDPLNEYRTEAFSLFEAMLSNLRRAVTSQVVRVELVQDEMPQQQAPMIEAQPQQAGDPVAMAEAAMFGAVGIGQALPGKTTSSEIDPNDPSTWGGVNRNDPCPCGSGKKFKHCHGKLA